MGDDILERTAQVETQTKRIHAWKEDIARELAQIELRAARLRETTRVAELNKCLWNETRARLSHLSEVVYMHLLPRL